ncbi:AraC family transcriptional regulator [Sulfuricurvum sp.]|uniref:AraC family transcriptional regulator n=1 Tax=Sulfuricurvum sp. TaxID=2025608 RepID=UPI002D396AE4|nr:AraC family transcriptional regulator [Sulfuricurvum sp.]HZF71130.1 AraC family transcriptional regulator [Sulfuricurvum sp.]
MKDSTQKTYFQSVYRSVKHIEEHSDENLSLDELAKIAGFSKYHFHRIFKSIVGESVGDYIRRVRLQKTTIKFKTDRNITSIAMESGYETSAAFSKVFKEHFGQTPSEFSRSAKQINSAVILSPRFVEIEPFDVLYVRRMGPYYIACNEAWDVLLAFAKEQKKQYKKNLLMKETIALGIGHDNPNVTSPDKLRCDACISYNDKSVIPSGEVMSKTIDGGKYAVFLHKGAYEEMRETYRLIGDWIVKSGAMVRGGPMFRYLNRAPRRTKPENLRTEIYIPIS